MNMMVYSVKKHTTVALLTLTYTFLMTFSNAFAANTMVRQNLIKASNTKSSNAYAFERCRALQAKPFDESSSKKKVIIIGDSQGCDFLNGALENGYLSNYQIRFRFIPYSCQRVPGENIGKYIAPKHRKFCLQSERADSLKKAKHQVHNADLVIFSALWKPEVARKLPQTFRYLGITKKQNVVVIGNKFFGNMSIRNYIHMQDNKLRSLRVDVGTTSLDINSILKKKLNRRVMFVDPHKLVCGNSTTCPVFTNNLRLISYDGRHLTKAGARYIGKILFKKSALGEMLY
ncbi:MAG: SGNH hydrolase domain-containing protein [Thiotrichaceae bacterium]